jgi:hypothetical protein
LVENVTASRLAAHAVARHEGLRLYQTMFERSALGQLIVDFPSFRIESNGLIEMRSQPPPPKVNSGQWGGPERRQGVRDRAGNGPEGIEAQGFWLRRTQNPSRLCT